MPVECGCNWVGKLLCCTVWDMLGRIQFLAKLNRWIEYGWYKNFIVLSDLSYGLDVILLLSKVTRPSLGPTQRPVQKVLGAMSPGSKRPVCDSDHSHSSSSEVTNVWICTRTLPISPRRTQGHALPPQSVLLKLQEQWIGDCSTSNSIGVARLCSRLSWVNTMVISNRNSLLKNKYVIELV